MYDIPFMLLFGLLSILSAYVFFDVAGRIVLKRGYLFLLWIACGAIATGTGIWSVYFIGMLTFHLPVSIAFNLLIVFLAMFTAIAGTGAALFILVQHSSTYSLLFASALCLGTTMVSMHQAIIAAMNTQIIIHYNYTLLALSFCVAVLLSFVALHIVFSKHTKISDTNTLRKLAGSGLLGLAILGMHYTAMASTTFITADNTTVPFVLNHSLLASCVGIMSLMIALLTIAGAFLDRCYVIQLQYIFDTLDVSLWTRDIQNDQMITCSPGTEKVYGIPAEAFMKNKRLWKQLIYPGDEAFIKETETNLLAGKPATREYRIIDGNGKVKWLHERIIPTTDRTGMLLRFDGVTLDITQRKLAEQTVREERNFSQAILDTTEALIIVVDIQGRIVQFNRACEALSGYSFAEVLHQPFWETRLFENLGNQDMRTTFHNILSGCFTPRTEQYWRTKHGTRRLISWNLSLIRNAHGSTTHIMGAGIDITELRLAEELLRKSEKLSVAGQLAAGVAHEIRNPLTTLKGFLQLLYDSAEEKFYFDIMLKELHRIENITSEFLLLAKPEAVNFQAKNVISLLDDVVSLATTQAIMKNITIITDYALDIGVIYCEENRLKQVFIHLLQNAMEAMPNSGEITLQARMTDERHVLISIKDQGYGIEPERLAKLGEPFYTTKEKGTGLGLMISYKIIESHEGTIKVESNVGKGTSVHVLLPAHPLTSVKK